jgi:excisionase family DNA binding protein
MGERQRSRENYTPREIGKLLSVHHNTVKNWIRMGRVESFTTVGGHFRVPRREVARLLADRGLPVPEGMEVSPGMVYVVGREQEAGDALSRALRGDFTVVSFRCPFEALMQMGRLSPDLLVLDLAVPGIDHAALGFRIQAGLGTRRILVMGLGPSPGRGNGAHSAFDGMVGEDDGDRALVAEARRLLPQCG